MMDRSIGEIGDRLVVECDESVFHVSFFIVSLLCLCCGFRYVLEFGRKDYIKISKIPFSFPNSLVAMYS
jgi:hypothetical protein